MEHACCERALLERVLGGESEVWTLLRGSSREGRARDKEASTSAYNFATELRRISPRLRQSDLFHRPLTPSLESAGRRSRRGSSYQTSPLPLVVHPHR